MADYDRQAFAKAILESRLADANLALVLSESRLSELALEASAANRNLAQQVQSCFNANPYNANVNTNPHCLCPNPNPHRPNPDSN